MQAPPRHRLSTANSYSAPVSILRGPHRSNRRNETRNRRHEWREFCAAKSETAREWWAAYAATYDGVAKWSRKQSHSAFCYDIMARMLALASSSECGSAGEEFATAAKRRAKLLTALLAACRKDALRATCVPLAALHLCALPEEALRAHLADSKSPLKDLVAVLLPRRSAIPSTEQLPVEEALLAIAYAQPGSAYILSLLTDALQQSSPYSPSQRALFVRVLLTFAEARPATMAPHKASFLYLLRPILRSERAKTVALEATGDGGSDGALGVGGTGTTTGAGGGGSSGASGGGNVDVHGERSGLLPAVLLSLPRLWPTDAPEGDVEAEDLAIISELVRSEDRATCHAAFHCLQLLMQLQRLRLTGPVLRAVGRVLLTCDGSRPTQLLRTLNLANFLVRGGVDALTRILQSYSSGEPNLMVSPTEIAAAQRLAAQQQKATRDTVPTAASLDELTSADSAADAGDVLDESHKPPLVSRLMWDGVRVVIEASCLLWLQHSFPEVVVQAAAVITAFDSEAALRLLAPLEDRPSLRSRLGSAWGDNHTPGGGADALFDKPMDLSAGGSPTKRLAPMTSPGQQLGVRGHRQPMGRPDVNALVTRVEAVLSTSFESLFGTISLAWMQLANATATGPRMEGEEPGGAQALRLWEYRLRFLCLFARDSEYTDALANDSMTSLGARPSATPEAARVARCRTAPSSASQGKLGLASGASRNRESASAPVPWLDPFTGTHGATGAAVETFMGRLMRWMLTGPPDQADAILGALRGSNASILPLVITHLKQVVLDVSSEAHERNRGITLGGLFNFGSDRGRAPTDPMECRYYEPNVVRLLADQYAKLSASELVHVASTIGEGSDQYPARQNPASMLGSLCSAWLREGTGQKGEALLGKPLTHAATLMACYLRFLQAQALCNAPSEVVAAEQATPELSATRQGSHESSPITLSPTAATTPPLETTTAAGARDVTISAALISNAFILLQHWMRNALSQEPQPNPSGGIEDAKLPAASQDGIGAGSTAQLDVAALDLDTPLRLAPGFNPAQAVLLACDALVELDAKFSPTPPSVMNPATPSAARGRGGLDDATSLAHDMRSFLEVLLTWPSVRRSACRSLGLLLYHHPAQLELYLLASASKSAAQDKQGYAASVSGSATSDERDPTGVAASPAFAKSVSRKDSISADAVDEGGTPVGPKGATRSRRNTYANPSQRERTGGGMRASTMLGGAGPAPAGAPHSIPSGSWVTSLGGVATADGPGVTYGYFHALVSNCTSDMARWVHGIEARLLFLVLLHQVSPEESLRDLAIQLAQALAHSPVTHLIPPQAHQLPWVSSRAPLVYTAAPLRYSSALAAHQLHLLPGLIQELVTHFDTLSVSEREACLQLLLPWLRALADAFPPPSAPPAPSFGETLPLALDSATPPSATTLHQELLAPVLRSLFDFSRLTALTAAAAAPLGNGSRTAESAHLAFLVEAAWAAVSSDGSAPFLVPNLTSMLLECHTAANVTSPPDYAELALCARVLLLECRTNCASDLLRCALSHLRDYRDAHCPPVAEAADWLAWRVQFPARREPLRPAELSVVGMLVQLPYEQHVLLPAYLPLLLHLLSAVYAEGTASVLSRATDPALAVHDAANLLESLVANLAPRGQSPPLSQRQLLILLRRVALLL